MSRYNLDLARSLLATAPRVYPQPGLNHLKDRIKYCLRGLLTPNETWEWFEFLSQPELAPLLRSHSRILSKLQRPYLHLHLRAKQRLKILKEHFGFAMKTFSPAALEKIYSQFGVRLASL